MSFHCGIAKLNELYEELDLLCEENRAYKLEIYLAMTVEGEKLAFYGLFIIG